MPKRLRSPIWWYGGKGHVRAKLLPLFPEHHTYVEAFGGGATMLFAKPPSPVEVYNDIDEGLVNFFRVLRDPERFEAFYHRVSLTPYARAEYDYCRATWQECDDPVERAYRWYVVARMSFGGWFNSGWGSVVTQTSRGMANTVNAWLAAIEMLPEIASRLMRVQIECQDWRTILKRYDRPRTLFYLDPPYVHDTRSSKRYEHELTLEDHRELVERLLELEGMVILSGYEHEVYEPLTEAGWRLYRWETACFAAGRTRATGILGKGAARRMQPRIECAWVSPNCAGGSGDGHCETVQPLSLFEGVTE